MPTSFALKSHRVAISLGLLKSHRVAISLELLKSHRVAISLSSIALPKTAAGGVELRQKVQIPLSLLALKFWSNKIIDVDIILSITLTVR